LHINCPHFTEQNKDQAANGAASGGKLLLACVLVSVFGANPNFQDGKGKTALHYACISGHSVAASVFLRHGADPDMCDGDGATSLQLAAARHAVVVAALLLDHGAQVNKLNEVVLKWHQRTMCRHV
jgi:ankyrin repeat protein